MSLSQTRKEITYNQTENIFEFNCPHCDSIVIVNFNEVNCQIFRHAVLKENGNQINPHASKQECDDLIQNNLIYGCGKPFRIYKDNNSLNWNYVDICDYI